MDEVQFQRELRFHVAQIVRQAKAHQKAGWSANASEWLEDAANELLDAADGSFEPIAERVTAHPSGPLLG